MLLVITHLTFKTHLTELVVTVSTRPSKGHEGVLDLAKGNDTRSSAAWLKAHVFHLICGEVSHQSPSCLACVTTFLAACCSPPSRPLRILAVRAACFRGPAVTRFALLPWHTDCVLGAASLPGCAPLQAANHQYAPGFWSFASVKSWPSQLPEVELPPSPVRLCCAHTHRLCVCAIFPACVSFTVFPLQDSLKAHIYWLWFWTHWVDTSAQTNSIMAPNDCNGSWKPLKILVVLLFIVFSHW